MAGVLFAFVPNPFTGNTRAIFAWDAGCLWFVLLMLRTMTNRHAVDIEQRAAHCRIRWLHHHRADRDRSVASRPGI